MRGVKFISAVSLLAGMKHSTCQHNTDYIWKLKKTIKFQLRFKSGCKFGTLTLHQPGRNEEIMMRCTEEEKGKGKTKESSRAQQKRNNRPKGQAVIIPVCHMPDQCTSGSGSCSCPTCL
jgi:hypothetical protein